MQPGHLQPDLFITAAIVVVLRDAVREVYRRLMDAVNPALLTQAEQALAAVPGVVEVGQLRLRWIGHQLHADGDLVLQPELTLAQAHQVTVTAEQHLTKAIPRMTSAVIHPDPRPRPDESTTPSRRTGTATRRNPRERPGPRPRARARARARDPDGSRSRHRWSGRARRPGRWTATTGEPNGRVLIGRGP